MMVKLFLHGHLRACGGPYRLNASCAADAVRALCLQHDALATRLCYRHLRLISGAYRGGAVLSVPAAWQPLPHPHLHLVPVIAGAGRNDGKLILGMTLLGLSVVPGLSAGLAGTLGTGGAGAGASAGALSSDLLARQLLGSAGTFALRSALSARTGAHRSAYGAGGSSRRSDLIAAPASTDEGQPVPLIYGRVRVTDPPVISSSLIVEARTL